MDAERELAGQVRSAADARTPLVIRAGGTKDFYGNGSEGTVLDPRAHAGIVAYEPTELVVTVRAGTALAELEAALDASNQMLPFEPPHFAGGATVGGCVAAGLAGPRRASFGATSGGVRDFVLGARLLNGKAETLKFGGTVMKNVAGYDVARLLAGSLGILGVILDVSLKVLPKPVAETTLRFELDQMDALHRVNDWAGQPLPISATAWMGDLLYVRLSGAAAAVQSARERLGGEALDAEGSGALWRGIRDHRNTLFGGDDLGARPLWRLSVPSTAEPLQLPGSQLIEWSGALRWLRSDAPAATIRGRAETMGGHATLFRGGDAAARAGGVFAPLPPPLLAIHRRLKAEFDPAGIFNRGRLVPGI
jgi:glycolate oxidase FAD binding subunit